MPWYACILIHNLPQPPHQDCETGGSTGSGAGWEAAIPSDFSHLHYSCLFCGQVGDVNHTRQDWRSKSQCRQCFLVTKQGWKVTKPKDLLEQLQSNEGTKQAFMAMRARYSAESGTVGTGGRMHVAALAAPTVNRVDQTQRVVKDAPCRWIREDDYEAVTGRTAEQDGLPLCTELINGVWERGYKVYLWDPRVREIHTERSQAAQLTVQVDMGTEDGGEHRPGQLRDSFNVASACTQGPNLQERYAMAGQRTVEQDLARQVSEHPRWNHGPLARTAPSISHWAAWADWACIACICLCISAYLPLQTTTVLVTCDSHCHVLGLPKPMLGH